MQLSLYITSFKYCSFSFEFINYALRTIQMNYSARSEYKDDQVKWVFQRLNFFKDNALNDKNDLYPANAKELINRLFTH